MIEADIWLAVWKELGKDLDKAIAESDKTKQRKLKYAIEVAWEKYKEALEKEGKKKKNGDK